MARNSKSETKKPLTLAGENVSIDIREFEKDNLLGFATVTIYGFIRIYNCTVMNSKNGVFLSMPKYKGSNGDYYNYAYIDKEDKDGQFIVDEIDALIKDHYNK